MDRPRLEIVSANELLSNERRHRCELGRELCRGMRVLDLCCGNGRSAELLAQTATTVVGVDRDSAVMDLARAGAGSGRVSFEAADPVSFLDRPLGDHFDAIVCLEGWEQRREPEGLLAALRRHAEAGIRLVYGVANGGAGDREREQATTDGYEKTLAAFAGLRQTTVLCQYLVEGSVICPSDAVSIDSGLVAQGRLEIELATHFIFCIGFPSAVVAQAPHGRLHVDGASTRDRYVINLEAANLELLRTNARLAREHLAAGDAGAATGQAGATNEIAARDEAVRAALIRAERAEQERDLWRQRCLAAESHSGAGVTASGEHSASDLPPPARPAQAAGLEVREVADGLIVHEVSRQGVHYLNNTAAVVFQLCDGDRTVPEISEQLKLAFGLPETPAGLVEQCIVDLRTKGVLC